MRQMQETRAPQVKQRPASPGPLPRASKRRLARVVCDGRVSWGRGALGRVGSGGAATHGSMIVHFYKSSNSKVRLAKALFSGLSTVLNGRVTAFPSCPTSVHTPRNAMKNISNFRMRMKDNVRAPNSRTSILITVGYTTLGMGCGILGGLNILVFSASSFSRGGVRGTNCGASGPFARLGVSRAVRLIPITLAALALGDLRNSNVSRGSTVHYGGVFTLNLVY